LITMKKLLALAFAISATTASAATYNLVQVSDTSLFGTTIFDSASGTVDGDPTAFTGPVAFEYINGTAGFTYSGDWTWNNTAIGVANLSCTNTGAQDACGNAVGAPDATFISQATAPTADGFELTYVTDNGFFVQTQVYTFELAPDIEPPIVAPPVVGAPPATPTGIPTLPTFGLMVMAALLAWAGKRQLKKI
jgi:hypothetical protein